MSIWVYLIPLVTFVLGYLIGYSQRKKENKNTEDFEEVKKQVESDEIIPEDTQEEKIVEETRDDRVPLLNT